MANAINKHYTIISEILIKRKVKPDPVGSTVRYEMMKLYWVSIGHYEAIAVGNSLYWVSIYAFIY